MKLVGRVTWVGERGEPSPPAPSPCKQGEGLRAGVMRANDLRAVMRELAQRLGVKEAAKSVGLDWAYYSRVMRAKKPITATVAEAFGLEVVYAVKGWGQGVSLHEAD